jgi:hypothetical protein
MDITSESAAIPVRVVLTIRADYFNLCCSREVMDNLSAVNQRFDDMREAIEHFNPLRARRIKSDGTVIVVPIQQLPFMLKLCLLQTPRSRLNGTPLQATSRIPCSVA